MRTSIVSLGLLLAAGAWVGVPARAGDDTAAFFSGRDFSGWEGLTDPYWAVKDGAIVGRSDKPIPFNTFLCSTKKHGDFDLKFEVRLKDGKGNSGVQIRSHVHDRKTFTVWGPQCDIGAGWWGSLFGEHFAEGGKHVMLKEADGKAVAKALKKDDFNEYHIRAVGKHVTIKVNDVTTVDGDFPKIADEGIIAFQLHSGAPMEVTFRNIRFTDLSKKK